MWDDSRYPLYLRAYRLLLDAFVRQRSCVVVERVMVVQPSYGVVLFEEAQGGDSLAVIYIAPPTRSTY